MLCLGSKVSLCWKHTWKHKLAVSKEMQECVELWRNANKMRLLVIRVNKKISAPGYNWITWITWAPHHVSFFFKWLALFNSFNEKGSTALNIRSISEASAFSLSDMVSTHHITCSRTPITCLHFWAQYFVFIATETIMDTFHIFYFNFNFNFVLANYWNNSEHSCHH